ncbi:MAG: BolA/IbaG family iron-sulfur metabolism protein, partial [Burkholderiales bacterium]
SARFKDQPLLARHRMVYEALGPLMHREIHALAIQAYAPGER